MISSNLNSILNVFMWLFLGRQYTTLNIPHSPGTSTRSFTAAFARSGSLLAPAAGRCGRRGRRWFPVVASSIARSLSGAFLAFAILFATPSCRWRWWTAHIYLYKFLFWQIIVDSVILNSEENKEAHKLLEIRLCKGRPKCFIWFNDWIFY